MKGYAVTTFSEVSWPYYGKQFVDSFLQHWPIPLIVFGEGQSAPEGYRGLRELIWYDLHDDAEHEAFGQRWKGVQWNSRHNANMMSVKFSHKVFAITSPKLPQEGWRIWLDADAITTKPVEPQHLDAIIPNDKAVSYLGRVGDMRIGQPMYPECGFVGYNQRFSQTMAVLEQMRQIYTSGELFKLGRNNWHDSYVFDYCKKHHIPDELCHDLTKHITTRQLDVWEDSVLAEFMEHYKGPRKKIEAYGHWAFHKQGKKDHTHT